MPALRDAIVRERGNLSEPPTEAELAAEDFSKIGRVHDWRNYIPDVLRVFWRQLGGTARLSLWTVADDMASYEEWD